MQSFPPGVKKALIIYYTKVCESIPESVAPEHFLTIINYTTTPPMGEQSNHGSVFRTSENANGGKKGKIRESPSDPDDPWGFWKLPLIACLSWIRLKVKPFRLSITVGQESLTLIRYNCFDCRTGKGTLPFHTSRKLELRWPHNEPFRVISSIAIMFRNFRIMVGTLEWKGKRFDNIRRRRFSRH